MIRIVIRSASQTWSRVLVALVGCVMLASFAGLFVLEGQIRNGGRGDLVLPLRSATTMVFLAAVAGSAAVGAVLALRRPANLAGWLFLALGKSIALSAVAESYAVQGAIVDPGSLPGARLVAVYADGVYGNIGNTLEHLLWSELRYHQHLSPASRPELPARAEHPELSVLQRLADDSAGKWAKLVDSLREPGAKMQLHDGKRSAATIVTELLMHGCEHRAHVGTILGARGIEPPDLDAWAWGIFVGGDDWPADWGPEPQVRIPPFAKR